MMLKKWGLAFAACAATVLLGTPSLPAVSQSPDRLLVVDCLLPAQVRRLGGSMTYLGPRRAVKSIASECEIRGGEYVAFDRANFSTSLQVWKPQAEQGDPQAQVYVGEIFEKGLGTTPDYAQAAMWYQKAADQGFARGLSDLAYLYEQGLGVPKDPVKALNLYRKSAGINNDDLTFASDVAAATAEATSKIDALTEQLAKSNGEIEGLRSSLEQAQAEARARSTALNAAQREAQALRAKAAALRADPGAGSPERGAELKRLERELAASEAKLAQQQADARTLEAANNAKSEELAERLRAAAAEGEQLRAQLGTHSTEAQQARAELAGAKARMDSMTAQISQLQQQLNAERAKVADERAKIARQSASHDAAAGDELTRLRQALADREARLSQQQALIATVQTERASQEQELERLKAQQAVAEQQQQQRTLDQKQQSMDREALRAQLESLQQKLLQSQQRLSEASAAAAEEKGRVEVDESKLVEQRARIAALEAESRSYSDEVSRLKAAEAQTVALRSANSSPVTAGSQSAAPLPHVSRQELNLGGYYALIVGNNSYQNMPNLESAVNDARSLERVLKEHYGFKTRLLINATRADILGALNEYRQSLGERDSLLIYYAGHGELNERNLLGYWLPVNAKRDDTTEWISDRMITDQIGLMSARHVLVIADSCYSGAMTRSSDMRLVATTGQSGEMKRLLKLALLPSRTVLTSGGVAPVLDGGAGANSIFARSLIDALSRNHAVLEGSTLYDQVFDPVRKAAARFKVDQSPRYSALSDAGHLNGEFLLIPVS